VRSLGIAFAQHLMLPRFVRRLTFSTQLAVVLSVVVVMLALAVTAIVTSMMQAQIERDKGAALAVLGRSVTIALGKNVRDRLKQVDQLVEAEELWDRGLASEAVQHALERMKRAGPVASWIGVADLTGHVVSATDGLLVGAQVKERPWYAAGLKGRYVGDAHPAKLLSNVLPPSPDGAPLRFIDFAAPIERHGQVVGVVAMHADLKALEALVASFVPKNAQARHVEVYVLTAAGDVIYGSDRGASLDQGQFATEMASLPALPPGEQGRPAIEFRWNDGSQYLTTSWMLDEYTPGVELGWRVLVRQPLDIAYAPARQAAQRVLLIGLFLAFLVVPPGLLLARQLTKPLARIARAARDVESDVPGASIPDFDQNKELKLLSGALQAMTGRLEGLVQERTEQLNRANDELRALGEEQNAMLDNDLVGIVRQDMNARKAIWNNRAMARMFGYEPEELIGHKSRQLYADDATYQKVGTEARAAFAQGQNYITKIRMRRKDGSDIWVHLQGTPLTAKPGEALWMMTDVTSQQIYQEQVEHIAFHDALTGLPNRLLLADRLRQAIASAQRTGQSVAVAYVDLDGFKAVNDMHGHDAGDSLLREISRRMAACVRAEDTVARLGGDEFVLILSALTDHHACDQVLNRVLTSVSEAVQLTDDLKAEVGCSIGVALWPQDGAEPSSLLAAADAAMYRAKHAGRGCIVYASAEESAAIDSADQLPAESALSEDEM
jgi:diguanylate cyclase (GGDEF)-like protein/PAS domain S-box-containing protein